MKSHPIKTLGTAVAAIMILAFVSSLSALNAYAADTQDADIVDVGASNGVIHVVDTVILPN